MLLNVIGTLVAATPTPVYTCPAGKETIVQSLRVNNPAAYVFTLKRFENTTGVTTQIYQITLAAGDTLTDTIPMILKAGDSIELTSDIANTNYIVYLSEY